MVEKRTEIDEIFEHISAGNNFLLSGGAGSGKTYSLVEVLKVIYKTNPLAKVACITYTNVAANEIKVRAPFENLRTSTIHDFLWDTIQRYQNDLKKSLLELINNESIKYAGDVELTLDYFIDKKIEYREWKKIEDGVISHDEVIILSEYMFAQFHLLSDIVKDKYDFILIDEYQDTFEKVILILLNHLQKSNKNIIIGLFGDSMQSIYQHGIGDIQSYVDANIVKEVVKNDNRRNPKLIIDLANHLRTDSVRQEPADDKNAPNFGKQGTVKFLYSDEDNFDIDTIKNLVYFEGWNFNDKKETKELYLTHNLIAPKAGFPSLMYIYDKDRILEFKRDLIDKIKKDNINIGEEDTFGEVIQKLNIKPTGVKEAFIAEHPTLFEQAKKYSFNTFRKIYLNKDQLIGDRKGEEVEERKKGSKRDNLIKHLFNIQECVFLYKEKKYNEFIKKTNYKIMSVQDKIDLKMAIEKLSTMNDCSIDDVINFADETKIWQKDDNLKEFIQEKEYVFNRVKNVKYQELINLYNYFEGYTPYSTQHNIKGAEFDNVLVVLDNGGWNHYNFEYLFENRIDKDSVLKRTQKLFYVCCTRAKQNLVVFYYKPTQKVIAKAIDWFGKENVHPM